MILPHHMKQKYYFQLINTKYKTYRKGRRENLTISVGTVIDRKVILRSLKIVKDTIKCKMKIGITLTNCTRYDDIPLNKDYTYIYIYIYRYVFTFHTT